MVTPVTINRRIFCGSLAAAGLLPARPGYSNTPLSVTDMAGRTVGLSQPPKRIVLLEARDILSMALLHPDPASLVVGWAAVDRIDSAVLQNRFAERHKIEIVERRRPIRSRSKA